MAELLLLILLACSNTLCLFFSMLVMGYRFFRVLCRKTSQYSGVRSLQATCCCWRCPLSSTKSLQEYYLHIRRVTERIIGSRELTDWVRFNVPTKHVIHHVWDQFYGSSDPTNSVKALEEDRVVRIRLQSHQVHLTMLQ